MDTQGTEFVITRDEIRAIADETGLTPNVVEKDYVLGWLLAAVNANDIFQIPGFLKAEPA
jgi:predicted nucleotidyltransferase component of viral defense system